MPPSVEKKLTHVNIYSNQAIDCVTFVSTQLTVVPTHAFAVEVDCAVLDDLIRLACAMPSTYVRGFLTARIQAFERPFCRKGYAKGLRTADGVRIANFKHLQVDARVTISLLTEPLQIQPKNVVPVGCEF